MKEQDVSAPALAANESQNAIKFSTRSSFKDSSLVKHMKITKNGRNEPFILK
eukprot:SAG31_NODE_116_length_24094_cov_38.884184_2_plen_52_part_00